MAASGATKHLFLTGYRGSGKTSVARLLSTELQLPWVDCDQLIESAAGQTIAQIFQVSGETAFRDWESQIIAEVTSRTNPTIVSLGGGAILRAWNRERIRNSGWCAWLKASPEVLAKRIASDHSTSEKRPALSNLGTLSEIESILETRTPLYSLVACAHYDTESKSLEEISAMIGSDYSKWLNDRS